MDILFRIFDIEARSWSEMTVNAYYTGRQSITGPIHPKYKCGWHKTWNNKSVYLRSSLELEYANKLDQEQIDYDVECLRIKYFDTALNRHRIAIPDFYIPASNTIVEVKGMYFYDHQNIEDRKLAFSKLGYNFELYIK